MIARTPFLAALAVLFVGCQPPPEAPTDLSDLSLYLFANFDTENPSFLEAGVANLLTFLEDFESENDLSVASDSAGRAWSLPPLTEDHWGGAPHLESHNPDNQLPVALAARSAHGGSVHAELVGLVDQTPLESSTSAAYDRSFQADFEAWLDRDVEKIETINTIHRLNFLLDIVYTAGKDYRWVDLPDDGGAAVISRSWIDQEYIDDPHRMDFFSNVELTIPSGQGTLRYNALWGSVIFDPEIDEAILLTTVRNGLQEGYENTEAYLDAQ